MELDFDTLSYPDTVTINGEQHKAKRDINKSTLLVPYTTPPTIKAGDIITQQILASEITLKVIDYSLMPGGTFSIGTPHQNLLTVKVENMTSDTHKKTETQNTFNIASLNANQVQVGNNNTISTNITIENLVKEIANSKDPEAKSIVKKLLENSTVGSVIGAGTAFLLSML